MYPRALSGVIPVAPTVFRPDESLDLEGQSRVIDFLVDCGSDAVCVLANFSEQFSLTDDERHAVMARSIDAARGRVPVVVTTSHFSARVAAGRNRSAQKLGAEMVMMMPPFFGASVRVADDLVVEYFQRVTDGLDIDVMIQDAPMSTTPLSVGLLARIAREVPQVRYAKIEVSRSAQKIRDVISSAGEDLPGVFDGEESVTLIPDLDAGAVGSMCSALLPDLLSAAVHDYLDGRVAEAAAAWESALPLIQYENRQCGLRAAKIALAAGGIIASDTCRSPWEVLDPRVHIELLGLARRNECLVLRWGK